MAYWIGRMWLWAFGWRVECPRDVPRRFVFVAAPHTSNWDIPFMLACAYVLRIRISWLAKHTLFEGPFGWLFRRLGGVPVDRRSSHNVVDQIVARFDAADELMLAVSPEGTRGRVAHWRSGFYYIARGAGVPIGLGFLDYARRAGGFGVFVQPTDDVSADMDRVRAFYRDVRGKRPALECVPRLREESEAPSPAVPGTLLTGRPETADRDATLKPNY